jgi:UPF0288 family protein (methanogenesis marker protein 3)
MKNGLKDLNNHLFMQLERLGDEDLSDEELKKEVQRTKAIASIASNIVNNANLIFNAKKTALEYGLEEGQHKNLISE